MMGKWADSGYEYLYQGDFDRALEHFRKGAEENDAESCFGIVELYGNAKPKDPAEREKAVKEETEMLEKAARLGHGKAIVRLSW
jgi:TPR repeat protein